MKKVLMTLLFAGITCSAYAKDANCKITLDKQVIVNNTCSFIPFGNDGSFRLTDKHGLYQDIEAFKVQMAGKDVAKIYAEGIDGDLNYWGKATRSKSKPACWNGRFYGNYQICAYAK